jgi:hypothetical protein
MKGKIACKNNYAVTEIVSGLLMVSLAVVAFAAIYVFFIYPAPDIPIPITIYGAVNDQGLIVLEHMGGVPIESYRLVVKHYPNGTIIGTNQFNNDFWEFGQIRYPLALLNLTDIVLVNQTIKIKVELYSLDYNNNEEQIFNGILSGKIEPRGSEFYGDISLITSLRTNTTDEDILCYNWTDKALNGSLTYIYNWIVNGYSITNVILPFDTNTNISAKDYSGSNYNGTLYGPDWSPNGIIGGCYFFDGGEDLMTIDLPPVFSDISRNDFTVSVWFKSSDIRAPHKTIIDAGADNTNFVKIKQFDSNIYYGVFVQKGQQIECVAGTNQTLENNTWYHIAATWNSYLELGQLFLNGEFVDDSNGGTRASFSKDSDDGAFLLGGTGGYWYGYLDEFQLFDRALSPEQIYQLYLTTFQGETDIRVMVSEETSTGDTWQCLITPNDSIQDLEVIETNTLQIINYEGGE